MVRIISGSKKGHKLEIPSTSIRPTIDRVKEALFSIIGEEIVESTFLDMFSGSGAIGLEALSRGAQLAVFVDNNSECIRTIKKNLNKLKLIEKFVVIHSDAFQIHKYIKDIQFDIVFIDPPYQKIELQKKSLNYLLTKNMIHTNSLIILEAFSKKPLSFTTDKLSIIKEAKYGDTILYFYRVIEQKTEVI